jgi:hypothetical protein
VAEGFNPDPACFRSFQTTPSKKKIKLEGGPNIPFLYPIGGL